MAVDGQGNAIAVWQRFDGTNFIMQAAVRAAGGSFGAPQDLSAAGQTANDPQVAVVGRGNAIAVWSRSNGTNFIVQAAVRAAGGSFGAPQDLSAAGQDRKRPAGGGRRAGRRDRRLVALQRHELHRAGGGARGGSETAALAS